MSWQWKWRCFWARSEASRRAAKASGRTDSAGSPSASRFLSSSRLGPQLLGRQCRGIRPQTSAPGRRPGRSCLSSRSLRVPKTLRNNLPGAPSMSTMTSPMFLNAGRCAGLACSMRRPEAVSRLRVFFSRWVCGGCRRRVELLAVRAGQPHDVEPDGPGRQGTCRRPGTVARPRRS